jgi:hypothetical protein
LIALSAVATNRWLTMKLTRGARIFSDPADEANGLYQLAPFASQSSYKRATTLN